MSNASQAIRRRTDEGPASEAQAAPTGSLLSDLRSGGDGTGEAPVAARPRRGFPTQHLVTILVLVAGGGALVAMRQYGMGAGMTFDKTVKVDFVETTSHKRSPEQDRILTELERGVTAVPPAPADIEKNPFLLVAGPSPIVEATPDTGPAEAERTAEERRRRAQDVEFALTGISLNGVMAGEVPLARVNGEIVRVGDTVAELFTVAAIQGRSILLTADGQVFIVEMSQESAPRPQPQVRPRTGGR